MWKRMVVDTSGFPLRTGAIRFGPSHSDYGNPIFGQMKTNLAVSVDRATLAKAKRKLKLKNRSISAEVDALLGRIASEEAPVRLSWTEQFGDLRVSIPLTEGEGESWYAKHLRH